MKLGRPMLVVPPQVDHLKITSVLVGWKDTRNRAPSSMPCRC
jgi:hypothetical protein